MQTVFLDGSFRVVAAFLNTHDADIFAQACGFAYCAVPINPKYPAPAVGTIYKV